MVLIICYRVVMLAKTIRRIKNMSLTEVLLVLVLLSIWVNGSREKDISEHFRFLNDKAVDIQNDLSSHDSDLQKELRDIGDTLEQLKNNQ